MSITRRDLFGGLGAVTVAGVAASTVRAQEVSGATPPAKVIDIHTHMYSEGWAELLRNADDPNVQLRPGAQGDSMFYRWTGIGGLAPAMFDWAARIAAMDEAGVDIAVISLSAPNVYWGGRELSALAARQINNDFANAEARFDGRIRWMASLPWDYQDEALEELRHARALGAVGVCTLTNILGRPLTDERYAPVWREIEAMELPVFVHPTLPFEDGSGIGSGALANAIGFTSETSLCFARMVLDGFLDRYPKLNLIASHGGGALPFLAQRIDRCWDRIGGGGPELKQPPSEYLRRLYFDSIVYDQLSFDYLIKFAGPGRVLYGSDYPFSLGDMPGILARVDQLSPERRNAIRSGNALQIFDL